MEPSGCGDLDEWCEWFGALDGVLLTLGCPPMPAVEYVGDIVRVWADADDFDRPPPNGEYIDIKRTELPGMLRSVQRDLTGFLGRLRDWAGHVAPDRADALCSVVDTDLTITQTLPASGAG